MHHGGGIDLAQEFFQKELKLNIVWYPILLGPQAFGWFKRPIKNLADFKGMKCRQTGMAAEVFPAHGDDHRQHAGRRDHPVRAARVIDCAEWVGGVEDLRLGFHNVWKYHYTPGVHENVTIGEVVFNVTLEVALAHAPGDHSLGGERNLPHLVGEWQRQNADAIKELQEKHGVRILRTPPDILYEFLKTWDTIAAEEGAKNPFFKKVHDSQRAYASLVVPAKRFMFPPYSFVANYYWPEHRRARKGRRQKIRPCSERGRKSPALVFGTRDG